MGDVRAAVTVLFILMLNVLVVVGEEQLEVEEEVEEKEERKAELRP